MVPLSNQNHGLILKFLQIKRLKQLHSTWILKIYLHKATILTFLEPSRKRLDTRAGQTPQSIRIAEESGPFRHIWSMCCDAIEHCDREREERHAIKDVKLITRFTAHLNKLSPAFRVTSLSFTKRSIFIKVKKFMGVVLGFWDAVEVVDDTL